MAEHDYDYQLRPLAVPAVAFLIFYPAALWLLDYFGKFPVLEIKILSGIYAVSALILVIILIVIKSTRVRISDQQISFRSLLGTKVLKPQAIRRVAFYYDRSGREMVQIRTEKADYYLNDHYFPFPELMADLEEFVQRHNLRYTLKN